MAIVRNGQALNGKPLTGFADQRPRFKSSQRLPEVRNDFTIADPRTFGVENLHAVDECPNDFLATRTGALWMPRFILHELKSLMAFRLQVL
jgi:hypothetical protein